MSSKFRMVIGGLFLAAASFAMLSRHNADAATRAHAAKEAVDSAAVALLGLECSLHSGPR